MQDFVHEPEDGDFLSQAPSQQSITKETSNYMRASLYSYGTTMSGWKVNFLSFLNRPSICAIIESRQFLAMTFLQCRSNNKQVTLEF